MPTQKSTRRQPGSELVKPIAVALAVKLAALAALYLAFFRPEAPPDPVRAGAAILDVRGK